MTNTLMMIYCLQHYLALSALEHDIWKQISFNLQKQLIGILNAVHQVIFTLHEPDWQLLEFSRQPEKLKNYIIKWHVCLFFGFTGKSASQAPIVIFVVKSRDRDIVAWGAAKQ
jgi:hypothetical protein